MYEGGALRVVERDKKFITIRVKRASSSFSTPYLASRLCPRICRQLTMDVASVLRHLSLNQHYGSRPEVGGQRSEVGHLNQTMTSCALTKLHHVLVCLVHVGDELLQEGCGVKFPSESMDDCFSIMAM
ncbi:hypothetical protein EYF80_026897 [Liparis tanakae]|uniref:Uncharacterized protein n=1 Tax=Liparis tanakae TaxID=230148 RepID=A0A4Z2HDE7_9TELE|nr:hypothetical protein EYF80_026897 [Liparis tanakae]